MRLSAPVPILRSFDGTRACEFYLDFLGFTLDREHRFAPDLPLYMQIRCDDAVSHLSEHHGDAPPGERVRIATDDVAALCRELTARAYPFARPGLQDQPWGQRELRVTDPFGNGLVFWQDIPGA